MTIADIVQRELKANHDHIHPDLLQLYMKINNDKYTQLKVPNSLERTCIVTNGDWDPSEIHALEEFAKEVGFYPTNGHILCKPGEISTIAIRDQEYLCAVLPPLSGTRENLYLFIKPHQHVKATNVPILIKDPNFKPKTYVAAA
jgi:hypothetical protein